MAGLMTAMTVTQIVSVAGAEVESGIVDLGCWEVMGWRRTARLAQGRKAVWTYHVV